MGEKFYVLIVKKDFDNMGVEQHDNSYRSKSYSSRKEAEERATDYLLSGRTEQYYIMECVGVVRRKPVDIEKISFRK